jgi:hypothetical protein
MNKKTNKLTLVRETIATLGVDDLAGVAGGVAETGCISNVSTGSPTATSLTTLTSQPRPVSRPFPTVGGPIDPTYGSWIGQASAQVTRNTIR